MKVLKFVFSMVIFIIPTLLFSQVSVHISPNCEIIATEVDLAVSGDWINNGTFTSNSSNLNFTGEGDQTLTPPEDNTMASLTVDKADGDLILSDTLNLTDSLSLISGNLLSADSSLLILLEEAVVNGGNTSSFVDGPIAKVYAVSAIADSFIFPIGDSLDYRPVIVEFATVVGDSILVKVEQVNESAQAIASTYSQLSDVSALRYWNIHKYGPGSFTNARVTLSYDTVATSDSADVAADLRMAQLDTSATWTWGNIGGTGSADSTGTIQGDVFSDFQGGKFALGTLPLVLTDIIAFMEGPYDSDSMNTYLRQNALLPLAQPYSGEPWNYTGTETVSSVPSGVVDWVLVELRTGTSASSMIGQRTGFLLSDGHIVDTDGVSPLTFKEVEDGDYYVVIYNRNHCAIMSATPLSFANSEATGYDFASDLDNYYGGATAAAELESEVWGMWSSDINNDGQITTSDYTLWYNSARTGDSGYLETDINYDGQVTTSDYTIWYNNARVGASSGVPENVLIIARNLKKKKTTTEDESIVDKSRIIKKSSKPKTQITKIQKRNNSSKGTPIKKPEITKNKKNKRSSH